MAHRFPRGIDPGLLLSQVKNTMPYLFDPATDETALGRLAPAAVVREYDRLPITGDAAMGSRARAPGDPAPEDQLTHDEYYRLCVSAHYLTCGTPVPTDVDNQIRLKLWPAGLPLADALAMAALVLEARGWDYRLVTTRYAYGAGEWKDQSVAGHLGEWFTLAAGAYCALGRYSAAGSGEACARRDEILAGIADEVHRHSEIFGSLWRAADGIGALKASASLSHNFGDLDRVMDMWELDPADPLRLQFYRLGVTPFDPDRKLRYLGRLWVAGELYKSVIPGGPGVGGSLSFENHRHFALRKPRALRESPRLLVPTGPFFDDWGRMVGRETARTDGSASDHTREIVEALEFGSVKLPNTIGYGRALKGIAEIHPGLEGTERGVRMASQKAFEKRWGDEALRLMDEIPSRA